MSLLGIHHEDVVRILKEVNDFLKVVIVLEVR